MPQVKDLVQYKKQLALAVEEIPMTEKSIKKLEAEKEELTQKAVDILKNFEMPKRLLQKVLTPEKSNHLLLYVYHSGGFCIEDYTSLGNPVKPEDFYYLIKELGAKCKQVNEELGTRYEYLRYLNTAKEVLSYTRCDLLHNESVDVYFVKQLCTHSIATNT